MIIHGICFMCICWLSQYNMCAVSDIIFYCITICVHEESQRRGWSVSHIYSPITAGPEEIIQSSIIVIIERGTQGHRGNMISWVNQEAQLGFELVTRLIVNSSIKCAEREPVKNLIICEQISRDGLRIPCLQIPLSGRHTWARYIPVIHNCLAECFSNAHLRKMGNYDMS